MTGPVAAYLDGHADGRLHLQHGPIDLVIGLDGSRDGAPAPERETALRAHAFAMARRRFQSVLDELVGELPLLKMPVTATSPVPEGAIARRMHHAVLPFAAEHFITPMAAVAGAVADEMLAAMLSGFAPDERPARLYVNNGGDIALHLGPGAGYRIAIAREDGADLGAFAIDAGSPVRGIATSGRGGRSLSLGIADAVTVLAATAAEADAAASIVANGVDLPGHPAVERRPARSVVDGSDLGDLPVVTGLGRLDDDTVAEALDAGADRAETLRRRGLIDRAALFLRGQGRIVAPAASPALPKPQTGHHA